MENKNRHLHVSCVRTRLRFQLLRIWGWNTFAKPGLPLRSDTWQQPKAEEAPGTKALPNTTALVVIFLILARAGIVVILVMMVTGTNGMVVRFHTKGSNGIKNEQYHGSRHDITAK